MILEKIEIGLDDYFYKFSCFEFLGTIFYDECDGYVVYFDNWDVLTSFGDRVPLSNIPKYIEGLFDYEKQSSLVFFDSFNSARECLFMFASSNFTAKISIANALAKAKLSKGGDKNV